ncbi:hypothetical protein ACJX0J_024140, partial [Zea mays]
KQICEAATLCAVELDLNGLPKFGFGARMMKAQGLENQGHPICTFFTVLLDPIAFSLFDWDAFSSTAYIDLYDFRWIYIQWIDHSKCHGTAGNPFPFLRGVVSEQLWPILLFGILFHSAWAAFYIEIHAQLMITTFILSLIAGQRQKVCALLREVKGEVDRLFLGPKRITGLRLIQKRRFISNLAGKIDIQGGVPFKLYIAAQEK